MCCPRIFFFMQSRVGILLFVMETDPSTEDFISILRKYELSEHTQTLKEMGITSVRRLTNMSHETMEELKGKVLRVHLEDFQLLHKELQGKLPTLKRPFADITNSVSVSSQSIDNSINIQVRHVF
jgi:hypothetical protein